jgi:hypothetical protein
MEHDSVPIRIEIGWIDIDHRTRKAIPIDSPVPARMLLRCSLIENAIQQLATERGSRHARATGHALVRTIASIAKYAERDGCRLQLHTTNQTTAPALWNQWGQMALEIRAINGRYIQWDIAVFVSASESSTEWVLTGDSTPQVTKRADALVRRAKELTARKIAEREADREAKAEEHVRSFPSEAQPPQRATRATCLIISRDDQTVTEGLLDIGGAKRS